MSPLPLKLEAFLLTYALNALWQVPLVFAAAWIASRAARRAGPAFQHALWTTALFTEVLLPACSASPVQMLQPVLNWLASFRQSAPEPTTHITIIEGPAYAATGFHVPPWLLAVAAILYLAAIVFFAIRLAIGLHRTASLRRRAQPLDLTGHARQSYHRYAHLFAVNHAYVAASAEIAGPITLGIRRPVLLLPAHLDAALLDEDLDAALAHEFAHMRRRDFAKNLLYQLVSLPIAFHPVAWLTRSRMAETRELVCDNLAASAVAGRERYARSLLRLATTFSVIQHAPTPHAIGIFGAQPFKNFERRVMNLTHHHLELRGAARFATGALSLALIGGACTSALAFRLQVPTPQTATAPAQTTSPDVVTTTTTTTDTAAPKSFVLGMSRSSTGQPPQSIKVNVADAGGPNPVIKVITPEGSTESNTIDTIQIQPGSTARISAGVIAGQRTSFKEPIYPIEAKKAKLNGTVVLHAIIGKDGVIQTLNVLSSTNAIFNASALEAVKQWTYRPYLLNGDPTAVDTTITVNYALNPAPEPQPSPAPSPSASNPQPEAASDHVLHIGGDVKPPIVIRQGEPEYSREAKAAKFSGTVRVYLQVDTNGQTSHIRVVKGVGMGLDEKAVEAVSRYQFKPATLRGSPVPVDLYIDVNFQML